MASNYSGNNILPAEKVIAVLSYFSLGFIGFIWVVIGAITKQKLKPFLKFHIYQSIFLSILFFIVSNLLILVLNILGFIPYLNALLGFIAYFLSVSLINIGNIHLSLIQIAILIFVLYLSHGVVKNRYSYVPWVSDIIKYNVGRG